MIGSSLKQSVINARKATYMSNRPMRIFGNRQLQGNNVSLALMAGIGFESLPRFIEIFTPKRWELIAALKQTGPSSIYALAKNLRRHYRNVHKDVTALTELMVLEKDEQGRVFVPWDEIDVRLPLLKAA